jgi:hypothetical protein
MTRLSVNINKIATLRNSRGGQIPSVKDATINCQKFGAHGITVHPRPDERHITRKDVYEIKPLITTEFNIEGYPGEDFLEMVAEVKADQATLVPGFMKTESALPFLLTPTLKPLKVLPKPEQTASNFTPNLTHDFIRWAATKPLNHSLKQQNLLTTQAWK